MFLRGNYTIDFNAPGYTGLITNIENLTLTSATDERYARGGGTEFDYNLTLSDAIVGAGQELTVVGRLLMATETMILDGSQETDGSFGCSAARRRDTLKGGGQADLIHGNLGGGHPRRRRRGGRRSATRMSPESNSARYGPDPRLHAGHRQDRPRRGSTPTASSAGDQAFSWIGSQRVQRRRPGSSAPFIRATPGSSRATSNGDGRPICSSRSPCKGRRRSGRGLPALASDSGREKMQETD